MQHEPGLFNITEARSAKEPFSVEENNYVINRRRRTACEWKGIRQTRWLMATTLCIRTCSLYTRRLRWCRVAPPAVSEPVLCKCEVVSRWGRNSGITCQLATASIIIITAEQLRLTYRQNMCACDFMDYSLHNLLSTVYVTLCITC